MKNIRIGLFCFLLISMTNCSNIYDRFAKLSDLNLTPTDPQKVELFFTNNISKPYEPIGYVNIVLCIECGSLVPVNQANSLKKMKELAAKYGADAIVNITLQDAQAYKLIGLAVKWK